MATNLFRGEIGSQAQGAIAAAAHRIASAAPEPIDAVSLRAALHSVSVLALRYAVQSPSELQALLGASSPSAALAQVEEHLCDVARDAARRLS